MIRLSSLAKIIPHVIYTSLPTPHIAQGEDNKFGELVFFPQLGAVIDDQHNAGRIRRPGYGLDHASWCFPLERWFDMPGTHDDHTLRTTEHGLIGAIGA